MKRVLLSSFLVISAMLSETAFIEASDIPAGFQVFFNDASHSQSNSIDIELIKLIDNADKSIAAAFYSIGRVAIADAFIRAADRLGIDNVRIITDANNRNLSACKRLETAGLYVIDETCDGWSGDSLNSHNKFCVVDDEKVWTGSYNITDSGTIYNNNHAVAIDCPDLAQAFLTEFNEMWGAEAGPPGNCSFSTNKRTVIDNLVTCNGVPIEVYFSPTISPSPNTAYDALMNNMDDTLESIHFCMYTFTQTNLAGKLIQIHENGIHVQGVMDELQALAPYSVYKYLKNNHIDVIMSKQVEPHANLLHHKFAVFDVNLAAARVATGSYNWTLAAQTINDENTLIIHNQAIAWEFYKEFHRNYYGFDPGEKDPVIKLSINETEFIPGSYFITNASIVNPGHASVSFYEYIILDIGAQYANEQFYFWPSWSRDIDSKYVVLGGNSSFNHSILQFLVPLDMPGFGPLRIWAGMLDSKGSLVGNIDFVEFSFL
ncbi:MAG: phospholipase D-like domain-containing protein [bacterium]